MGKRKSSDDSDKIRRKIKKLQKKLKKKKEEEQGIPPPRSSSGADTRSPSPVARATLREPQLTTEPVIQIEVPEEDEIPSESLTALGSEGLSLEETGQAIHQQLVARWGNIIVKGLTRDAAATIIKKYPTPSNFKLVVAPEMNPEIVAAFSEPSIKRDKRIMARQNALGKTITCIGQIITNVMRGNINSKEIIEKLSDAAKITAEVIHQDSISRKFFALSGTTSVVKEALKNAKTEGMLLFGTDCADKIRAAQAQAMQKTATQIKENIERYNKNQKKLNWKSPLPQQRRSGPSTRQPAKPRVNQQQNTPRASQQTAPRARQQRRRSPPQQRHHRR